MDPTARFTELVQGPEDELPLDEGALLVGAHVRSELDVAAKLRELDHLARSCGEPTLDGLGRHLFAELGFTGNVDDYHDPRNSFLDQVIERRTGSPITLAVVMIEVGRRTGVPLEGVGMPGHFLVRQSGTPPVYVDAFDRGRVLGLAECEQRFHDLFGAEAAFRSAYLEPVGPRAILARVLVNLRGTYAARRDVTNLAWVLRLRLAIPGTPTKERTELSAVLAAGGQFVEAAAELDRLADEAPDEADALRREARLIRARLN